MTPCEPLDVLEVKNIELRPVWTPLPMQPLFEACKFYPYAEDDVVSKQLFETGICLPSGSNMTVKEQESIITLIKRALNSK